MDRTPEQIGDLVEQFSGRETRILREAIWGAIRASKTGGSDAARRAMNESTNNIRIPSRELEDVDVTVGVQISDPNGRGTFDRTRNFLQITVGINGYMIGSTTGVDSNNRIDIPFREQVALVRAVLGEELSDYAYRAVGVLELLEERPSFHIVFVDDRGKPYLAPSDFNWVAAGSGGPSVRPIKLPPAQSNIELRSLLKAQGDVIPIEEMKSVGRPLNDQVWLTLAFSYLTKYIADGMVQENEILDLHFEEVQLNEQRGIVIVFSFLDRELEEIRRHGLRVDGVAYRERLTERYGDDRPRFAAAMLLGAVSPMALAYREGEVVDGISWITAP
jgi:hypothetical protein